MEFIRTGAAHLNDIAALASQLWHADDFEGLDDLKFQFSVILEDINSAVFFCQDSGDPVGFAQFGLRSDYVEGTDKRPVGYLEGIFVKEQYRNQGIAKRFVRMGELWASEKGCSQLASDCELGNADSLNFHLHSGFSEANRIICFVKDINTCENSADRK